MSAKSIKLFTNYCREVKAKRLNIPAFLLVIYDIGVGLSIEISDNIIFGMLTNPEEPTCWVPFPEVGFIWLSCPNYSKCFLIFYLPFSWLTS